MNKNLRTLVHDYRVSQNLNFRELSKLCGYSNHNKGTNKICNFEREGVASDGLIRCLINVLKIPENLVRSANKKDLREMDKWFDTPVPMELIRKPKIGIYMSHPIPPEIDNREKALAFASLMARNRSEEACLVLSRRESVWFRGDGSIKFRRNDEKGIVAPLMRLGNRSFLFQ